MNMNAWPEKPVEDVIAEVLAARGVYDKDWDFFVADINKEVAERCRYETTAWYISEAIKRVYGARRRRWEHGRTLVYDFPYLDANGAPVPAPVEWEAA